MSIINLKMGITGMLSNLANLPTLIDQAKNMGLNGMMWGLDPAEVTNITLVRAAIVKANQMGISPHLVLNISKYNNGDFNSFHTNPTARANFIAALDFVILNYTDRANVNENLKGILLEEPYRHYISPGCNTNPTAACQAEALALRTFYNKFFLDCHNKLADRILHGLDFGFNHASSFSAWPWMGTDAAYIKANNLFTYYQIQGAGFNVSDVSGKVADARAMFPNMAIMYAPMLSTSTTLKNVWPDGVTRCDKAAPGNGPISYGHPVCWNPGAILQIQECVRLSIPFSIFIQERLGVSRSYWPNVPASIIGTTAGEMVKNIIGSSTPPPPTTGTANLQSSPTGASIRIQINGIWGNYGVTPRLKDLSPGNYTAEFTLTGYPVATKPFTITAGQTIIVSHTFVVAPPTTGTVIINSSPIGANVLLNNVNYGKTPFTKQLFPGTYTFDVSLAGYQTIQVPVTIIAGQTITKTVILIPVCVPNWTCEPGNTGYEIDGCGHRQPNSRCNPAPTKGSLDLKSTPESAEVYFDGINQGLTPVILTDILAGPHEVKLLKAGYLDIVDTVTIVAGESLLKNYPLVLIPPTTGTLTFVSVPPGSIITLNDIISGTAPISIQLEPGHYTVKASLVNYPDISDEFDIAAGETIIKVYTFKEEKKGGLTDLIFPVSVAIGLIGLFKK